MLVIIESPIGPCVLFTAPKTGATSIAEMARRYDIEHQTSTWSYKQKRWIPQLHEMDFDLIRGKPVVVTVRDPRTRLLSLWKHYCNENKSNISLKDFIAAMPSLAPFFRDSLHKWYADLLDGNEMSNRRSRYEIHFLRLETFTTDVERLLGWNPPVHTNRTKHEHWKEHEEEINSTDWWKRDLELFGDHQTLWDGGVDEEKKFWNKWTDHNWVKDIRNIKPLMNDLVDPWTKSTEVLDVASGAISMFGRLCNGVVFKIVQADALESWFSTKFTDRPNEAHQVKGEDLKKYFGNRKFDAVVSSNGIDHSADPKTVLENMAAVSKGPIYLEHYRNCAVLNHWGGLHQWNFDIREGRVVIWSQGIQLDVANILGITNWESGLKKIGEHWVVWFKGWK